MKGLCKFIVSPDGEILIRDPVDCVKEILFTAHDCDGAIPIIFALDHGKILLWNAAPSRLFRLDK
jgi:hypothetical protein